MLESLRHEEHHDIDDPRHASDQATRSAAFLVEALKRLAARDAGVGMQDHGHVCIFDESASWRSDRVDVFCQGVVGRITLPAFGREGRADTVR